MKRHHGRAPIFAHVLACVALALALAACSKPASRPNKLDFSVQARANLERALGTYETIRQQLALDQFEISSQAQQLAQEVSQASAQAPAIAQPLVASLADAAGELEQVSQDDPQAMRDAFGAVSRAAVALIEADGALSEGRQVYECPMTDGYGRWIQVAGKISNPYMGSRMPQCGTLVETR